MRQLMLLIALTALVWSGLHAGPAEAHENDPAHWAQTAATEHDGRADHGSDRDVDQHGCHHHCPSAPTPQATQAGECTSFGKQLTYAPRAAALHSTSRAPPLDPPIS